MPGFALEPLDIPSQPSARCDEVRLDLAVGSSLLERADVDAEFLRRCPPVAPYRDDAQLTAGQETCVNFLLCTRDGRQAARVDTATVAGDDQTAPAGARAELRGEGSAMTSDDRRVLLVMLRHYADRALTGFDTTARATPSAW